jgi:hypothetical protein
MKVMSKLNDSIFTTTQVREHIEVYGYSIIDFPDARILDKLKVECEKAMRYKASFGLFASNHELDFERNEQIENGIIKHVSDPLDQIFQHYHFLTGHFMIKSPSPDSEFQLHQDWSITDEQAYDVVHLWIPLQDTNPDNGGMFVVEGSHLFFNNLRSGSLDIPRLQTDQYIKKMITPLSVKRGQMLVYHPALFHGSFPNNSAANREVVLINLLQKNAPLLYYHLAPTKDVEVYALSKKTLMSDLPLMAKGGLPAGLSLLGRQALEQSDNAAMSSKDLYKRFRERNAATAPGFFHRMRRMLLGGH